MLVVEGLIVQVICELYNFFIKIQFFQPTKIFIPSECRTRTPNLLDHRPKSLPLVYTTMLLSQMINF